MRTLIAMLALCVFSSPMIADDPAREAPKVVVKSVDGKTTYDLDKLTAKGPVLVRLTCACSGCDQELPYFQKLHEAYKDKGFQVLAAFQEKPETTSTYVSKKGLNFLCVADPEGDLWKRFDTKTMPTNILIDKGGKVVKVVKGCARDGKNAQLLSADVAGLLQANVAQVIDRKVKTKN
jgi:peroxiredoxin